MAGGTPPQKKQAIFPKMKNPCQSLSTPVPSNVCVHPSHVEIALSKTKMEHLPMTSSLFPPAQAAEFDCVWAGGISKMISLDPCTVVSAKVTGSSHALCSSPSEAHFQVCSKRLAGASSWAKWFPNNGSQMSLPFGAGGIPFARAAGAGGHLIKHHRWKGARKWVLSLPP
ncbi:uncharacterized protein VTP21DRAFT_1253 [Calcarisporiella thermophila]|uniref:uncharacterized protein n=1 Tax=Calcarisporiella thermophila TaxID=911321 RepID=UPI00374425A3